MRVTGYPAKGKSFRSKLAAEVWASRTEAAAKGRISRRSSRAHSLRTSRRGITSSCQPFRVHLAYWREPLGDVRLDKITPELIAAHRDRLLGADCRGYGHRSTKPRSPATVRNYLVELSRLFALAVKELRVMESTPFAKVTKPPASRKVVRFLADDERDRLLSACKASESRDLYPFVLFALTTGARKSEIAALEWPRVDLARRWAIFPTTKNGDSRGVPLTEAVCVLFAKRPRIDKFVFPADITTAWHTAIERAAIREFRFHDLRHSCASALVQNGADLAEVATLLGHRGPAMSLRYAHVGNAGTMRLVDRVMETLRDVPFFFKQWGGVRKHTTGRLLDHRTYDEMPRQACVAQM